MLSFTPPARPDAATFNASLVGPLAPAAYLTLCRESHGYTPEQLARALVQLADHQEPLPRPRLTLEEGRSRYRKMLGVVRLLERRGAVARHDATLEALASVFRFDPAVYRALAVPTAHQQRVCRSCGCSDHCSCHRDADDSVCRWVTPALCSHCVDRGVAAVGEAA